MGGFVSHRRCLEELKRAKQILYASGHFNECEAVAQAIVLLEYRPQLTDEVFNEIAEQLRDSIK